MSAPAVVIRGARRAAQLASLAVAVMLLCGACSAGAAATPAGSGQTGGPSTAPEAGSPAGGARGGDYGLTPTPAGTDASAAPPEAASGNVAVDISGFVFDAGSVSVAAGSTITWTNRDGAGHTVTADDGTFSSPTLQQGATFSQTFATAGTFNYHCAIHPRMHGTVNVTG
jgi:plastocyanin